MQLRLDRGDIRLVGVTIVVIALIVGILYVSREVNEWRSVRVDEVCRTNTYCRFFTTGEEEWYEAFLWLKIHPSHVLVLNDSQWLMLQHGYRFTPVMDWNITEWDGVYLYSGKFQKPAGEKWHFVIYREYEYDTDFRVWGGFGIVDMGTLALYWTSIVFWALFMAGGIWLTVFGGWSIKGKEEGSATNEGSSKGVSSEEE